MTAAALPPTLSPPPTPLEFANVAGSLHYALAGPFTLPDDTAWPDEIVKTENAYEMAKIFEMTIATAIANHAYTKTDVWDACYARAVASSEAKKKDLAESDPEWRAWEKAKLDLDNAKREAEKWHSIAFQRLTTLRELFAKVDA